MASFVNKIKLCEDYMALGGVSEHDVQKAEELLGLKFADDYRNYLIECGIATADGHEFTGIGKSKRLDVITNTLNKRSNNSQILSNMYVIEVVGIDGIVIWQDSEGYIYQSMKDGEFRKIADTLESYF